jgi:hypothetical protein
VLFLVGSPRSSWEQDGVFIPIVYLAEVVLRVRCIHTRS